MGRSYGLRCSQPVERMKWKRYGRTGHRDVKRVRYGISHKIQEVEVDAEDGLVGQE